MRRLAAILAVIAAGATGLATSAGADDAHTYELEMYNAFGIVEGSNVRIAGVNAGAVTDLAINEDKRALVTIELTGDLGTLGEDTECASEPQSLIAEYFISCEPAGPPLEEDDDTDDPDADIPASQVSQTVQTDLVQNTLREPYRRRLQLLINEFGTALAGNPETLNEAIRLGAPALTELREVTRILASQNRIIRDLNVNSDRVIGQLADRREDVVRFIEEARDTAAISVTRRDDLSRNFEILDDFLAELDPVLVDLETLADEQTPLLTDLRAAAPDLNTLATTLPAFNSATDASLSSLGEAAVVGGKALRRGRDEIQLLAEAGRKAPVTAEALADFVRDIDDPRRAVEIDERAARDTGRTNPQPATKNTKGYTGFESLLNFLYYVAGTSSQFDRIAHSMHINFQTFETGPCGHVSTGRDPETGATGVPTNDGGTTTDILEVADCVQWLGPNQPGITEDDGLPKYDPAVCPKGTEPEAAAGELCDPGDQPRADTGRASTRGGGSAEGGGGDGAGGSAGGGDPGSGGAPDAGGDGGSGGPGNVPDDVLDDLLDLPDDALDNLPGNLGDGLRGNGGNGGSGGGGVGGSGAEAAEDLLDFLLKN